MNKDHLPIAGLSGFVLALALAFGQLTRPDIIIGWVDVFGAWNPHMLVFFFAATVVYHGFARIHGRRQCRAGGAELCPVVQPRIDARLLVGATIFGIGWALGGACPGPAFTSLGAGASWAAVFVGAMTAGLALADQLTRRVSPARRSAQASSSRRCSG